MSFEGIDGSGKSTQLKLAAGYLRSLGLSVATVREPGSTPLAEQIRSLLLDAKTTVDPIAELLLYEAARADLVAQSLIPALQSNNFVLIDRFFDSTTAYQGYGRKLDITLVRELNRIASGGITPDLTLIFDLPLAESLKRRGKEPDRLEAESLAFFRRVRAGFRSLATAEPKRCKLINSNRAVEAVQQDVVALIDAYRKRR